MKTTDGCVAAFNMHSRIELADTVNLVLEEQYVSPMFCDLSCHGTGICSIIGGNLQNDAQGVNPNAALYSVKVLDANNAAPVNNILTGIYWCISNDMRIISMSFGTANYSNALKKAFVFLYVVVWKAKICKCMLFTVFGF